METVDDNRIVQLIAALDRDEDPLHMDVTPAARELGALGPRVIPHLLGPLGAQDPMTRLHAQRALEQVLYQRFGFTPGQGWRQADGEARWRELWQQNGSYDFQAPAEARDRAIAAWRQWSAAQE